MHRNLWHLALYLMSFFISFIHQMLRLLHVKALFFILGFTITLATTEIQAQGISTEGKDFWVGFMSNWDRGSSNPIILELYVSADDSTRGTVTMPRIPAFAPINFEVYPNETRRIVISTLLAMASGSNIIEDKGIHITTENNVSVYAMNKRQYSADMTVVLPTYSLGNNYYVLSHWEDGNRNDNANSDSEFLIVGITDSTEVEIIPTYETISGNPTNVPFRVTLHQGQTYQLRAKGDLTGSQIIATNQTGCQDFAVFSGNMYTQVGECNVQNGHDHLYAQMYPTNTLGKEFVVVPLENRYGGDIIKFLATKDNTTITANENTFQLDAGEYVKILSENVLKVFSDKPIAVGQYSRTMDCDGTLGDPFLIPISPNEQMLKRITFYAPSIATLSLYSVSIITRKNEIANITFDGSSIDNQFTGITNSDYAFARINTVGGNHTIKSNDGFIAYVYGFGHNESFGYTTGASLGNLNIDFNITDQNEKTPIDSLCLNSEIGFTPIADTIFTLFEYDFGDGTTFFSTEDTMVFHSYSEIGEYLVTLTASTGGDDCSNGNEEVSRKIIRVIEPYASIFGPRSVCPNTSDVAYFIDETEPNLYQWFIKGGDLSGFSEDSIFVDWGATNNEAQVQLISTNRYGCISDTISYPVKINIQLDPEAPFGPDTLCSDNILEIPYRAYYTNVSTYQWETDFGNISHGNGTNEVKADWESYGMGNLWFHQLSITDTLCDGTSDTLSVYIQRNPSETGEIITEHDTLMIGESIDFSLKVDSLYRFANWSIDDQAYYDTIDVNQSINHEFLCEGDYSIVATAFDTGTVCSKTSATIIKEIHVLPVSLEIINVSASLDLKDVLIIQWKLKNGSYYPKELALYRKGSQDNDWKLVAILDPDKTSYVDTEVNIYEESNEYKIVTNVDCENMIESPPHKSILFMAEKDEERTKISWNGYEGWNNGVDHYEIWLSIDSSSYELIETTSSLDHIYEYRHNGFDFCYYIVAIEKNGNNATSLSNYSCVDFVPEIKTYNVITPNTPDYNDEKNEYFIVDNIEHYPDSKLKILDRYGKTVFEATGYQNSWNGMINGKKASAGTYYFELELNEPRNEIKRIRGYFSILY